MATKQANLNKKAVIKVALFDADGVLALPEEFFSQIYARSRGLNIEPFDKFFKEEFPSARMGKADLKELIAANQDVWHWSGNVEELLAMWFQSEDVKNEPLIEVIRKVRISGLPCYLATNQEQYRGDYIRNVMFKDIFDGYFISVEMGV